VRAKFWITIGDVFVCTGLDFLSFPRLQRPKEPGAEPRPSRSATYKNDPLAVVHRGYPGDLFIFSVSLSPTQSSPLPHTFTDVFI